MKKKLAAVVVGTVVGTAALVGGVAALNTTTTSDQVQVSRCTTRAPDGGVVDVGPQRTAMDCMNAVGKARLR